MVWGGDPIFLKTSTCNPPHPAWVYQFWPLNRKKKKKREIRGSARLGLQALHTPSCICPCLGHYNFYYNLFHLHDILHFIKMSV